MPWNDLATQFALELAFGVLLGLCFVARAPLGTFFHRLMGTAAAVALLVAVSLSIGARGRAWSDPVVLSILAALAAYPVYSGPLRARTRLAGAAAALVACAAGIAFLLVESVRGPGALELVLASASALATGAVAGSVGLAMVLGHWYLTIPNLEIDHLRRLNRVTVASMALSIVCVALSCLVFAESLNQRSAPLFAPFGLFFLGTRVAVGLVFPLVFAAMAASALRLRNTRSATGILYASTVLVLIGAAISVSLQDSYGVPL
jgi:hypothetical protein